MISSTQQPPKIVDIDLLLFDFDGVLTDNRVFVSSDGVETVVCSRADGWGIRLLSSAGLKMAIISTEENPVVRVRAEKLELQLLQNVADKAMAVRALAEANDVALERVAFIGNDTNDLAALKIVGWPLCPRDANPDILAAARWIVDVPGGAGVARALATVLLSDAAPGSRRDGSIQTSPLQTAKRTMPH